MARMRGGIVELASAVATPFHAEHYATVVKSGAMARRREIIRISRRTMVGGAHRSDEPIGVLVQDALRAAWRKSRFGPC